MMTFLYFMSFPHSRVTTKVSRELNLIENQFNCGAWPERKEVKIAIKRVFNADINSRR